MVRTRAIGLITLALTVGAAVTACAESANTSDGSSAEGEELNIWYVNVLPSYPAWGASSKLFEDKAADMQYTATAVGPPEVDAAAMIQLMDQAIADGADGIITCDIDPATFQSTITRAQEEGIVVVTIGCVDEISD